MKTALVDCERGRALGCATFCCSLIVRLREGERDPSQPGNPRKSCVDKNPKTGRCVCLDPATGRCTAWTSRPSICREYDCNQDPNLQVVLRDGFVSLRKLIESNAAPEGPKRSIPYLPDSTD